MINTFVGNFGHLSTLIAFVSALVTAFAYSQYFKANELDKPSWRRFSRVSFYVHAVATLMIAGSLFEIIYHQRYEYFYAFSHSSKALPVHYMISSFWEGQEGAFILWAFWNVVLGLFLVHSNKFWEGFFNFHDFRGSGGRLKDWKFTFYSLERRYSGPNF
jgi:cytochrome c-type biogenesis protein CcmF